MTKPSLKSARMAALEQLSDVIERRLQNAGPEGFTVPEVAEGLGFSLGTVRARLDALQEAGRIYRERHVQVGRAAIYFTYHAAIVVGDGVDADAPRQSTVRNYPQNNQRDPLVAALFGQVGGH